VPDLSATLPLSDYGRLARQLDMWNVCRQVQTDGLNEALPLFF